MIKESSRIMAQFSSSDAQFNLSSYLEERKRLIESALDASLVSTSPHVDKIIESMRYCLLAGGKRLRPILCLATCEMLGGNLSSAMPTAVALEMIHTMSLVHDDLPSMENNDLRRGKLTPHKVYGEDIAILAGDALLAKSFEFVVKETKGIPADRTLKILGLMGSSSGALGLAGGQAKGLERDNKKEDVSCTEFEWIQRQKTAALLKVSVSCGATIAGASAEDLEVCAQYAEKIGTAFQITDEILAATATSEQLGHSIEDHSGNSHAKPTHVNLHGLEQSMYAAVQCANEAKECIRRYGDAAIPLMNIADYIISRKN